MDPASHVENAALADLHAAATLQMRERLGLAWTRVAGASVSVASALPASAIVANRTGLGPSEEPSPEQIGAIMAIYACAEVPRFFVHHRPEQTMLPEWLTAAGLAPARGWQGFRLTGAGQRPETDLQVREAEPSDREAFGRIAAEAFGLGAAAAPWLARLPGREDWHVFMAFDGATPVATGALFARDGVGWMDWGATMQTARRRGAQAALIAARIARARCLGLGEIFTCTGEAVPGDPQHSYRNLKRAGFSETTLRLCYAPPRAAA